MTTNVIVIDDDRDTVEIFVDYLELKGINVMGMGHSGKDAIELYLKHKPDVVLLDVMMPEYDGFFGLTNIIKQDPNAKVVMVTADMTDDTREKLTELKASGILYKPYEINTVLKTIEKVLRGEQVLSSNQIQKSKYKPMQ